MSFKLIANDISVEIQAAFSGKEVAASDSMFGQIAIAATNTMHTAGDLLKSEVRENIGAAGFSARWQNAWRVNVYPAKGFSIDASCYGHHNIPYSLIFETGGTIHAKGGGLLWIPLGNVPKVGRGKASPRTLIASGIKLFTIKSKKGIPLLATSVRVSNAQSKQDKLSLSLSKLRKGAAGKRGVVQAIPLFFGISSVTEKAKFNVSGVAATITARLGDIYLAEVGAAAGR